MLGVALEPGGVLAGHVLAASPLEGFVLAKDEDYDPVRVVERGGK